MRKPTAHQLTEQLAHTSRDRDAFMLATNALVAGRVAWLNRFRGDGGWLRLGYFGLDRADGGYILTTWIQDDTEHPNPYTTVQLLDEADHYWTHHANFDAVTDKTRQNIAAILREKYKVVAK